MEPARAGARYHARVSKRQHEPSKEPPLTDPATPQPSHAERARTLVAAQPTGTLATLKEGHPYASLVAFAMAGPKAVFLISEMAAHTKNLRQDPRASLLVAEKVVVDPLAHGRLVGECRVLEKGTPEDDAARKAFVARHPGATIYVDFKDFHCWTLDLREVRYIGGFGRMSWVDAEAFEAAEPDPLAPSAEGIIGHMNEDHADANLAYAQAFTRAKDATAARMTAVDRYGFDLMVDTPAGSKPARIAFDEPVGTPEQVRKAVVALVKKARAQLG